MTTLATIVFLGLWTLLVYGYGIHKGIKYTEGRIKKEREIKRIMINGEPYVGPEIKPKVDSYMFVGPGYYEIFHKNRN